MAVTKAISKAPAASKMPGGLYEKLIVDALSELKELTGSSMPAITKYVSQQNPEIPSDRLKVQLRLATKRMLEKETLRKIKASYKLTPEVSAAIKKEKARKEKAEADKKTKGTAGTTTKSAKSSTASKTKSKTAATKAKTTKAKTTKPKKAITKKTSTKKTAAAPAKKTASKKKTPAKPAPTKKAAPKKKTATKKNGDSSAAKANAPVPPGK